MALKDTIVDISQNHARRPLSSNGVAHTLTTSSKLYSFAQNRLLTGVEHLILQGYPFDLDPSTLSESDLRTVAGEGIALPCLGVLIMCLCLVQNQNETSM